MIRVLCYSEDGNKLPWLQPALGPGYQVEVDSNKDKVAELAARGEFDVLLIDFDSNYGSISDGLEVFNSLQNSLVPVVVMTDDGRRAYALDLIRRGAYDYFRKPPALAELRVVLGRACERTALRRELERTRRTLEEVAGCDGLIGTSASARAVYSLIRRVAGLNAPILIRGESGTGKELVARAIHSLSARAGEPFVAVPCGAIPETLIEAELFGHEKGSFTGAAAARAGYFEQAGEGTLLLDEIGELSLHTQVKLLRVLQQREFCRLGSCKLIPLRARILAATHRPLERMVEEGSFRMDLLFRINVMTIDVPPLRERIEDIPALARHFLEESAKVFQKTVREITPEAMELLMSYSWPGNIRELENVIQAALILTDDERIGPKDLPRNIQGAGSGARPVDPEQVSFEELLREYKAELVQRALAKFNGNKTLAARSLRISRAYLHRLLRPPERRHTAA
jgi:DNA-binding NtrC family response regulator